MREGSSPTATREALQHFAIPSPFCDELVSGDGGLVPILAWITRGIQNLAQQCTCKSESADYLRKQSKTPITRRRAQQFVRVLAGSKSTFLPLFIRAHLTTWPPGSLGWWAVRVCEQKALPGRTKVLYGCRPNPPPNPDSNPDPKRARNGQKTGLRAAFGSFSIIPICGSPHSPRRMGERKGTLQDFRRHTSTILSVFFSFFFRSSWGSG